VDRIEFILIVDFEIPSTVIDINMRHFQQISLAFLIYRRQKLGAPHPIVGIKNSLFFAKVQIKFRITTL
jgi:hypothetical protein